MSFASGPLAPSSARRRYQSAFHNERALSKNTRTTFGKQGQTGTGLSGPRKIPAQCR